MSFENVSGNANHVYSYDNLGRVTSALTGNSAFQNLISYGYDALGRKVSETSSQGGTKTMAYDLAGHRTRYSWGDGFFVTYGYYATGEMSAIQDNGGAVIVSFAYDDLGRRIARGFANGTQLGVAYDAVSRLAGLGLNGGTSTNGYAMTYNAVGQMTSRTMTNDAFAWTQGVNTNRSYATNALNQYSQSGDIAPTYDPVGNLISSGTTHYNYNALNELMNDNQSSFRYDAVGRLIYSSANDTQLDYDGDDLVAETDNSGAILRRYVHGPGTDEPLIWYEGNGSSDRRWLDHDERGSITRITNDSGQTLAINSYDEFGIPQSTNIGRFQYTGQSWLPELGLYYYKARFYSPTMGRFLQTDPIGYGDGLNWYNYVGGDPVNGSDPSGLKVCDITADTDCNPLAPDPDDQFDEEGIPVTSPVNCSLHPTDYRCGGGSIPDGDGGGAAWRREYSRWWRGSAAKWKPSSSFISEGRIRSLQR